MFQFKKLLTYDFWFYVNPVMMVRTDYLLLGLGVVFLIIGIIFKIAESLAPDPIDMRFRNRFYHLFLTIGISEIIWFGARYQNVKFFGTHFAAGIILLIGLIWLGYIIVDIAKHYKEEKEKYRKEQVRMKYLPHS